MIIVYIEESENESDVADWKVGEIKTECPKCHRVELETNLRRESLEMYTRLPNGNYQPPVECVECLMS